MLSQEIVEFFQSQDYVITSTLDASGKIHSSAKGIVDIEKDGRVYILDLQHGRTFRNLKRNSNLTITAVDGHHYRGYTLKGKARLLKIENVGREILRKWEKKISYRISRRLLKNIREDRKSFRHPEANFPLPKYLILMEVKEIINLAP